MGAITGTGMGGIFAAMAWWMAGPVTAHLGSTSRDLALLLVVAVAAASGFLAGGAIGSRASRRSPDLRLFTTVAMSTSGAVIGFAFVAMATACYLVAFGTWPSDVVQGALYGMAVPAFGLAGAAAGACIGAIAAMAAGGFLRILSPAWK